MTRKFWGLFWGITILLLSVNIKEARAQISEKNAATGLATAANLFETTSEKKTEDFLKYEEPQPVTVPDTWPLLFKTLVSLTIIVGIIYISAYFFKQFIEKRTRIAQSGKLLKTIDVLYLSPQRAVYLLGLPDKILVVGATDHNLSLLGEITDATLLGDIKDKGVSLSKPINFKEQLQKFGSFNIK